VALSLGACASLTPQQSDRMKEAQEIANETTKLYGVPHVSVFSYERMSANSAAGYAGRQGWILLSRAALDDTTFAPVLAHELGHATLSHDDPIVLRVARPTPADYRKAQQQRELDANARAVEIMVRVMGKTEPEALLMLASYLADANTSRGGLAVGLPAGHMHPCDQLRDLATRFPGDWSREVACAKATGNLPLFPYGGTDRELGLE
jgi:hypothetical protein